MTNFPDDDFSDKFNEKPPVSPKEQERLNNEKIIAEAFKNPRLLKRGLLTFAMLPFLMMSGCGAIGTFIISHIEKGFFASAETAEATVTNKRQESYQEAVHTSDKGRSTRYQTKWRDVYDLSFTDKAGRLIETTSAGTPSGQVLSTGSRVSIYYNIEDPRDTRFASQKRNVGPLDMAWKILLGIFLCLGFIIFRRRSEKGPAAA